MQDRFGKDSKDSKDRPFAARALATGLRLWQHSSLVPLPELETGLQDRILILRNHPQVSAMSHEQQLISYAAHQDYLRELARRKPRRDACVLYCQAMCHSPEKGSQTRAASEHLVGLDAPASPAVRDADNSLGALRPIVGVVNIDLRLPQRPLLGLYKNLYHYPHLRLGRVLLFAAIMRASQLGLHEVFLECYGQNLAMPKLARQLGFLTETKAQPAVRGPQRDLLCFHRYLPSPRKLLQEPLFSDFAALHREQQSLRGADRTARLVSRLGAVRA